MLEKSIHLLILDDSELAREIIKKYLRQDVIEYELEEAETIIEAMEVLKTKHIDVIFIDYYLKETTGIQFLELIRLKGFIQPAVILTGKGSSDLVESVLKYDVFDYIPKNSLNEQIMLKTLIQIKRLLIEREQKNNMEDELFRLSQAMELSPAMVTITDLSGKIQFINRRVSQISGYKKQELIGRNPRMFKSGLLPNKAYKKIWNMLLNKKSWNGKLHNKTKTGETYWVSSSISPIMNKRGEVTHFLAIQEDITSQVSKLDELERESSRFKLFLNASADGVIVHKHGNIIDVNQKIADIMDTNINELIGTNIIGYVHPDYRLRVLESMTSNTVNDYIIKMIRPDGREVFAKVRSQNITTNGEVYRVSSLRDITKEKEIETLLVKAKDEAEQANRSKSEFLAKMSHELRTPLNSIIGFAEVLVAGIDGEVNDSQKESLTRISKSGQNLLYLINDLLDFSKIEAGKMELNPKNTNIMKIIDTCHSIIAPVLAKKNLEFLIIDDSDNVEIFVDSMKIQQVLLNILSNSIKFTEIGNIFIRVSLAEDFVKIEIHDTGIGMTYEAQQHIFDEFKQADKKITSEYGGTGLGLAISKKLIELHNGKIWVKSEKDVGSTFFVLLPRLEGSYYPVDNKELKPDIFKGKILLIDDEPEICQILEKYLELDDYYCLSITDSFLSQQTALSYQPDLIISDIMMPGKDGYQVLQELKKEEKTKDIPVLLLSGFCDKQLGKALGAVDCIRKPIKRDLLFEKVEKYIKRGGDNE